MSNNSRGLMKAMMLIGSAQVIKILISVFRMKVLAVLLGPTGVGLLSIYNNLHEMVATAAGLGMESSGVREVARAKANKQDISHVRWVLIAAHLVQGATAMAILWLFRGTISEWLFGNRDYTIEVGLIGIAILFALFGAAQTAILQGLRQIGDLGRVTILSTLLGTVVGLSAVWLFGEGGLIWFVVAQPFAIMVIAIRYMNRVPMPAANRPRLAEVWQVWKPMAKLGAAFMLGALATTATLLLVRSLITQKLGLAAAGHYAAAWGITMTYIGFLLRAMAADYYPRLTEIINYRCSAINLINDQIQLGLAIGGPILLLMIGLAPWAITLLYSDDFYPATELLQWQTVGNVLKLASWPLVFSFVAASKSKTFVLIGLSFNIIFLAFVWLFIPSLGLKATAIAFLIGYATHFGLTTILAYASLNFRWKNLSLFLLILHLTLAVLLLAVSQAMPQATAILAIIFSITTGIIGLRIVLTKTGSYGSVGRRCVRIFQAIGWPIKEYQ